MAPKYDRLILLEEAFPPSTENIIAKSKQLLIEQGAPTGLYSYVSRIRHHAVRKDHDADVLVDYLSLFHPLFEDYARSQSQDKLALFQIGSWLVDMGLTAAAGDITLLRQQLQLQHIEDEMKRMDAPNGVQNALTEIAEITRQDEISDRDTDKELRLIKEIQSMLG